MCSHTMSEGRSWAHVLHPVRLQEMARSWLLEDTPTFDYGGFVVGEILETAVLLCKSPGVLAGTPFFEAVFKELDCTVTWLHNDGTWLDPVTKVAEVKGKVRNILLGERVALNCLARASGIATGATQLKKLTATSWHGSVAGTRKTTPGFRQVEKYALLVGGIDTHRHDLSSMIMLKDNHIWTAGSITQAVKDALSVGGFSVKVEVECRTLQEAKEAAAAGAHVIMFDNFAPQALHQAAAELKGLFPHVITEASGGINKDNLSQFCGPNVDVISLSRTTQGYDSVDFSLKILKEERDPINPLVKDIRP